MATALLITRDDIVKLTALGGNVDIDKFIQFVLIAQDIHLQNYLGTQLLEKIQSDILANTLSGNYQLLVEKYLKSDAYPLGNGRIFAICCLHYCERWSVQTYF